MITNTSTNSLAGANVDLSSLADSDITTDLAAASGMPSEAMLARLANEMFTALPASGTSDLGLGNLTSPSFPNSMPSLATPPNPMSSAELSALIPTRLTPTTPAGVRPLAAPPEIPSQSGAAFYFLDEGKRLGGVPQSPPLHLGTFQPKLFATPGLATSAYDVQAIRRDFPILQERVNGHPLIWLDNAATTHKPQAVIDRLVYFYQHENSNIHRAAHELAARASDAYEASRETVARFVNASSAEEIVFVRGATEAINQVAQSWGRQNVGQDDEVLITWLEHHANIVPWQQLCAEKGARLKVAPVDDHGQVMLDEYQKLMSSRTRLVAFPQVSNALGTVTPAREMIEIAHRYGARVLVDGAQSVSHMRTDVQTLDCDWFVFSGHKVFGPTGIGVLFGKSEVLEATLPWQGGGNMIEDVTFEKTTYQRPPLRFEAGTGNIADAIGLGAAIGYLESVGLENVTRYEHELLKYATRALTAVPGLRLIGTAPEKAGVLSFVLANIPTADVGQALSHEGIAVRAGHHCAQPILRRFGLESTVRPSLALYNTCAEIDAMVEVLLRLHTRGINSRS